MTSCREPSVSVVLAQLPDDQAASVLEWIESRLRPGDRVQWSLQALECARRLHPSLGLVRFLVGAFAADVVGEGEGINTPGDAAARQGQAAVVVPIAIRRRAESLAVSVAARLCDGASGA